MGGHSRVDCHRKRTPAVSLSIPRVLSIAGTDPTGGAGAQADLKSIAAAGGYGMNVTTVLVAQNTTGVMSLHTPPIEFLRQQLDAVATDVTIDAIKVGMLGDTAIIKEITAFIKGHPEAVVVIDPVMVATSGDRLVEKTAENALREFVRLADVITPNIPELALLADAPVPDDFDQAVALATTLAAATSTSVVVKGGHLTGADAGNTLVRKDGSTFHVPSPRVNTPNTHGTGCSLSSALATRLAADGSDEAALSWATRWLGEAIAHADDLHVGSGHGPVDHGHRARRLAAAASPIPWAEAHPVTGDATQPATLFDGHPILREATTPPTAPLVEPAGPWTRALWQATAPLLDEIMSLEFITRLARGTLDDDLFRFYLEQDAFYLRDYGRALAHLAVTAPDTRSSAFWAQSAVGSTVAEVEMHKGYLGDTTDHVVPSRVTAGYTTFLLATCLGDSYCTGAAAVLPCFWLYLEVGLRIVDSAPADHPNRAWIDEYSSPEFRGCVEQALAIVEEAFQAASPADRQQAARACLVASRHEVEFFDQAMRL
nr:bifunctional hydroxymethylpyrimidine kinase/phosphomethylpyrimidine kinase [Corynebacterium mendelii]